MHEDHYLNFSSYHMYMDLPNNSVSLESANILAVESRWFEGSVKDANLIRIAVKLKLGLLQHPSHVEQPIEDASLWASVP